MEWVESDNEGVESENELEVTEEDIEGTESEGATEDTQGGGNQRRRVTQSMVKGWMASIKEVRM